MATVKNITPDVLALFRADAPPVQPGDSIEVRDENFADRAWPKSTWALVKAPAKPYVDASTDDAHLFTLPAVEADPEETA